MITKTLLILVSVFFLLIILPNTNPVQAACQPTGGFNDCSCSTAGCNGLQTAPGQDDVTGEDCTLQQSCNTTPNSDSCNCGAPNHNQISCGAESQCTGTLGDGCGYCQTPVCNNNGSQDNGESGIDCGGGGCGACPILAPAPANCNYSACGASGCSSGQRYVSGSNCPAWFSGNGCYADGSCGSPGSPTPTSPPSSTNNNLPKGGLDDWNVTNCVVVTGWACDRDSKDTQIKVHFYEGTTWLDQVVANSTTQHTEQAVKDTCGTPGGSASTVAHGFEWTIPSSFKNNANHAIKAYGIDIDNSGADVVPQANAKLAGSPVTINCAPPCDTCGTGADACTTATACGTNLTGTCNKTTLAAGGACTTVTGSSCTITTKSCAAGQNCVSGSCCAAAFVCPTTGCHLASTGNADGSCDTTKTCPAVGIPAKGTCPSTCHVAKTTVADGLTCSGTKDCPANAASFTQSCPTACHTDNQTIANGNGSCGNLNCPANAASFTQSCPSTCHTNNISYTNGDGSCGTLNCGSNAASFVQNCPTTCHTDDITVQDNTCGNTKPCSHTCNGFTHYCNASGNCIRDIPWIQTTGGDVHSNTSINLSAPI